MLRRVWPAIGLPLLLSAPPAPGQERAANAPPVVEITAVDYAFQSPDSIPSGWVTLRMANRGEEHHHFHLYRLPDDRTYGDYREGFLAPADGAAALFEAGAR